MGFSMPINLSLHHYFLGVELCSIIRMHQGLANTSPAAGQLDHFQLFTKTSSRGLADVLQTLYQVGCVSRPQPIKQRCTTPLLYNNNNYSKTEI